MKSDNRYFMAAVDLLDAKRSIELLLENLERNLASVEYGHDAIVSISKAVNTIHRARLSDRSMDIPKGCQNGCGYPAIVHTCGSNCEKE